MFTRSHRSRARARRAAQIVNQHPGQVAAAEVRLLVSTLEDLIERLGSFTDPELKRLRKRAAAALESTRAAVATGGEYGGTYVREHPWAALGAVFVGLLAIGLWTGRSLMTD